MVDVKKFLRYIQDIHAKEADRGKKRVWPARHARRRIEELLDELALERLHHPPEGDLK